MVNSADTPASSHTDLVALLDWYRAAGVDCAVGETPVAWLGDHARVPGAAFDWPDQAPGRPRGEAVGTGQPAGPIRGEPARTGGGAAVPRQPPAAFSRERMAPPSARGGDLVRTPPARFASGAPDAAETAARALAARASDMTALQAALERFEGCALKATAKSTCVYRGAAQAPVMIIGEAPGRDEDLEGRPFVGRAGQLLDRMLAAIDLDDTNVHITNVVYWRPPGNRTPTPQETQICRPFLERQVQLVDPQVILLLGGAAAKSVLDTGEGIMRLRGKWREVSLGGKQVRALASLHPAYLLRTPAAKRMAWRDLLALKSVLLKK